MPRTAGELLLSVLQQNNHAPQGAYVRRLSTVQYAGIRHLLDAIDNGVELPAKNALNISNYHRLLKMVDERWHVPAIFENDADFSVTRLILVTTAGNRPNMTAAAWAAMSAQVVRMLHAGRIANPADLLYLAWRSKIYGDPKFAIELLAHTNLTSAQVMSRLAFVNRQTTEYIAKVWWRVGKRRLTLFKRIWPPGQVGKPERAALRHVPFTLLADLYAPLLAGGYGHYQRYVSASVAAA